MKKKNENSKYKIDYFYYLHSYIENKTIFKGEYEFKFHEKRKWRLDYAIPDLKVGFEVQGGVWTTVKIGKHSRGLGMKNDFDKMANALLMNWIVFYFVTEKDLAYTIYSFFIENEKFLLKRININDK